MKTPIATDMNLSDTTLLNTNHNSNYFNQSTYDTASTQILRSSNGTNFTLDNLESRGVNALHRRAEQLKRWQEAEEEFEIKKQQKQLDTRNHANLINKANLIFKKRNDDNRKIKFSNSTLFLAACASSDYDEINRLLNNNLVDINVGNIDGLTALHHACIDDNPELVEFLLKKGADVNCVDNEGWSPLHATASCDHIEIARLLLLYGADCKLVNVDHELALDLAEDDEMHKLLEDALYEQEKITDFDKLRRQEEEKMREDVLEMIKTGIYDNKIDKRTGATILHVAACKGYLDVLQLLLENKILKKQIDINVKENDGWTPLAAATYWTKPLVVELLLQNGADVNCVTNNNQTLEQMTDYDLILNLIATRREQLKKQENLRLQEENKENGNLNKSNAESETQRKAHAKRIRESRRSTQGISAEDVNKAKDQLLLNSSMNSTIINLGSNNVTISTGIGLGGDKQEIKENKVEITKLETINESSSSVNEEFSQIQSSSIPSIQKTSSHSDNCEIVEVKSVLDHVDGQRAKHREFTRPYRPKITIDETEDVDQELNATINLNSNDFLNHDKELKNDAVLNLRRDSLNILHQRKDTKKSAALNHSKDNASLVRVERLDDYQLPKLRTNTVLIECNKNLNNELNKELNNLEECLEYTVRRDISQDSLDEQTNGNHNDYIGINSTLNQSTLNQSIMNKTALNSSVLNYSIVNKNGLDEPITVTKISQQSNEKDSRDPYLHNKPFVDKQFVDNNKSYTDKTYNDKLYSDKLYDKTYGDQKCLDASYMDRTQFFDSGKQQYDLINKNVDRNLDRNVDKELKQQNQTNENAYKSQNQSASRFNSSEHRNLISNSNFLPSNKLTATTKQHFEVPVLIETPCTPEPPVEDENSIAESNSETTSISLANNSFEHDSENNVSKRKRTKKRIDNNEEIDALFNETMNTLNPKFTRNIEPNFNNETKNNYLYKQNLINVNSSQQPTNKSNGNNALKLYKKVDDDLKLPNSSVTRSRPSSTTSSTYKTTKDHLDGNKSDAYNERFVNDNLNDKTTSQDDHKPVNQLLINPENQSSVNQSTIISQSTLGHDRTIKQTKESNLDYKKMYEDLLVEFENFKSNVNKKEQDDLREKRKMLRKISELEEELVQMESLKEANERLKNENGALVRVISKLSK